jgi:dihydropteroate synthase
LRVNQSSISNILTPRGREFVFGDKTYLMGVLNVTPDSFYDGGRHVDLDRALLHAGRMVEEGVDIIDVGGESTRPGAEPVSQQEEIDRTLPVLEGIAGRWDVALSIDTYKSSIAREALSAGVDFVNDISGLRFDPEMAGVVARGGVPTILMHIQGTPRDMQKDPQYEDVVQDILDSLVESLRIAEDAGLPRELTLVDPGIGFGKRLEHNLEILRRIDEFGSLGRPILVGASRKSMIGAVLGGLRPEERLEGTLAISAYCMMKGVDVLRVHDVKENVRVRTMIEALGRPRERGRA